MHNKPLRFKVINVTQIILKYKTIRFGQIIFGLIIFWSFGQFAMGYIFTIYLVDDGGQFHPVSI